MKHHNGLIKMIEYLEQYSNDQIQVLAYIIEEELEARSKEEWEKLDDYFAGYEVEGLI